MTATKSRKPGRPPLPVSERAAVVVKIRLRPADAQALAAAAEQDEKDPAVWAREAVVAKLRRRP